MDWAREFWVVKLVTRRVSLRRAKIGERFSRMQRLRLNVMPRLSQQPLSLQRYRSTSLSMTA